MITSGTPYQTVATLNLAEKAKQLYVLLKFRLTSMVVFSGAFGYLLADQGELDVVKFSSLLLGSFMITGAANIINQIAEKDLDALMKRTEGRPLPTGKISVLEAVIFTLVLVTLGTVVMIVNVNPLAAWLSLLSLILYGFIYTPMKLKSPISVFIGAFPGAMPPLIGWAASAGEITMGALLIFGVQFIWQFPHFWAVAWLGDEDYRKAGMKMLPSPHGPNFQTAMQMTIYSLFLIPMGILPATFGLTGVTSAVLAVVFGLGFLAQSVALVKSGTRKGALRVLFASFIYLPAVQLAYLFDKV